MIEVRNLSKQYGDFSAVSHLTFTARPGDVVGLLGPNGAGKTTTLRMLATAILPTSGNGAVLGYDLIREANPLREHIGYLPDTPPLYRELTVHEYLKFIARLRGLSLSRGRERIACIIEQCDLGDVVRKPCGLLSKGFRQRVGIAQALLHDPEVPLAG